MTQVQQPFVMECVCVYITRIITRKIYCYKLIIHVASVSKNIHTLEERGGEKFWVNICNKALELNCDIQKYKRKTFNHK